MKKHYPPLLKTNLLYWFIALSLVLSINIYLSGCADGDDDDDNDASSDDDASADDDASTDDDATTDDDNDDDATDDDSGDDDDTSVDDDAADDDDDDDDDDECGYVTRGNLMWTQCDNGYDLIYEEAQGYIESLNITTEYDDWRLATRQELLGLYDEAYTQETDCFIPVHIVDPFRLSCTWVWSGEVSQLDPTWVFVVGFSHGTTTIQLYDLSENMRVLAVRDL